MTIKTIYSAWGGGASAGDLVVPGNNGGGYGSTTKFFMKFHEGTGSDIGDSVSGNSADFSGANPAWDSARGAFYNDGAFSSNAFTIPDLVANKDYMFFAVVENYGAASMDFRFGKGGLGSNYGFLCTQQKISLKNSTATYGGNFGTTLAAGDVVCMYAWSDDSAGELYTGYVKQDGTEDNVAVVSSATIASVMSDEVGITQGCYLYSMGLIEYAETGPTLATARAAAAWMAVQHTSAECKADPTKRIIYPGII